MIALSIPAGIKVPNDINPANFREYRLDYIEETQYAEFLSNNKPNSKTIITIRDKSEGGKSQLSPTDKAILYNEYITAYNCYVDFEFSLWSPELPAISKSGLILSYHNFDAFNAELIKTFIIEGSRSECFYLKLAVNVDNYSELTELEKLLNLSTKPILIAGMGKLGKLVRLIHQHLGAKGTYIGLDDNLLYPSQLSVSEAKTFHLHKVTPKTAFCGLLGGKQVFHSIGLSYYTSYFRKLGLNAFYLPFFADDFTDFWTWLEHFKAKNKFLGVSVTMPFKADAAKLSKSKEPVNLIYFNRKTLIHTNTDKLALNKAFFRLERFKIDSILIYGSGAMAELALKAAPVFGKTYLLSRNKVFEDKLCWKFDVDPGEPSRDYDLVINCTPLGFDNTELYAETGIKPPRMLIDLPYFPNKKSANISKIEPNQFVDGVQFWQWQAIPQLAIFLNGIKED
ncbi:MAG: type I 3-dehydroquinate dehydratase [Candidatus Zophobacter franzmannii]|nr:type I 3-dehydroquinate dehydratase [Candidatus Zophobacter franzmannii]